MKYFLIEQIEQENPEYCVVDMVPEGTNLLSFKMAKGQKMADDYPENARIRMSDEYGGILIADFLTNPKNIFPASRKMKEIIESMVTNEIEYLPFSLINHKDRVAANQDYFIINVIGSFDCLNIEASDIYWSEKYPDKIVNIDEFVLDYEKIKEAPHIFRIKEDPCEYVVSEELVNAFKAAKLTNINLTELEVV